ncbi:hypothetical protein [Sorangium sp. So ce1024]|uniref:hypothetical protein n=1 Tax=Sorangium sp. So ce1024 TaxID=3133327 RepID=UPI003F00FA80
MLTLADLRALADRLVQLHVGKDRDRGQVAIAGAGVAVTERKPWADAKHDRDAIRVAMTQVLGSTLPLELSAVEALIARIVFLEDANGCASIRVCGSELVGREDLTTATHRARSMRAVLVAELQRALADAMPPTRRRLAPQLSAEWR